MSGAGRWERRGAARARGTRRAFPYRSVGLALLLVMVGSAMLVTGLVLCLTSRDAALLGAPVLKGWSLMFLGGLMFLPGAYVTRIAFYAWQGRTGFSYEDIPDD